MWCHYSGCLYSEIYTWLIHTPWNRFISVISVFLITCLLFITWYYISVSWCESFPTEGHAFRFWQSCCIKIIKVWHQMSGCLLAPFEIFVMSSLDCMYFSQLHCVCAASACFSFLLMLAPRVAVCCLEPDWKRERDPQIYDERRI